MLLPLVWVILLMLGFAMMFWGVSRAVPGNVALVKWGSPHHRGIPGTERRSPDHTVYHWRDHWPGDRGPAYHLSAHGLFDLFAA